MRRIILAGFALALTGCAEPSNRTESGDAGAPALDSSPATRPPGDVPVSAGPLADTAARRIVLFVGTSLTAGYGVGEDVAYPALIQQKIDSAGLPFRVVNAGISGETSAGGLRRIDWSLQQPTDVLVLELGANDALRGLDPDAMERNLDAILTRARAAWPDIALVLIGMEAPPNLGERYTTRFRTIFRDLARRHDAALVPFLLDGVAAQPSLNIADGIHPNAAGHRIIARTVWGTLSGILQEKARQEAVAR